MSCEAKIIQTLEYQNTLMHQYTQTPKHHK